MVIKKIEDEDTTYHCRLVDKHNIEEEEDILKIYDCGFGFS